MNTEFDIFETKGGRGKEETRAWYRNGVVTNEPTKELTDRDHQAMRNFMLNNVSLEAIAENFECSVPYVADMATTRPWLRTRSSESTAINLDWWESDHSDPSELAKLFYPEIHKRYFPDDGTEANVKEIRRMVWEEYKKLIDSTAIWKEVDGNSDAFWRRIKRQAILDGVRLTDVS